MTEAEGWYVVATALTVGAAMAGFGMQQVRRAFRPLYEYFDRLDSARRR